ncbi:MAG: hypothetical protein E7479_03540 [Ruminococcaceae bacterium]|nr:hypothetical protein [Oscillospiraceae bacterium]
MNNKKKYKNKLSFWHTDNIVFFVIAIICILICGYFCYPKNNETNTLLISLLPAILPSVLIPLGLNFGKYLREKSNIKTVCKSIISLSIFMVNSLNMHLIKTNQETFSSLDELNSKEKTNNINFEKFETLDDVFILISDKLLSIKQMEYMEISESAKYLIEKTTLSMKKAFNKKDYAELYSNLCIAVNIVGTMEPSSDEMDYIETFNKQVNQKRDALKNELCNFTDDYIVECLENELSERINSCESL